MFSATADSVRASGDGEAGTGRGNRPGGEQHDGIQTGGQLVGPEIPDEYVLIVLVILDLVKQVIRAELHPKSLGESVHLVTAAGVGNHYQLAALAHEIFDQVNLAGRVSD